MLTVEKLPDAVQWAEGMLLAPHHFQQNHIYWENQLRFQVECLQPYYWGLLSFKHDESAFLDGLLRVISLQAVMPDGLTIDYNSETDQALQLDLKKSREFQEKGEACIHLIVPVRMEGAASDSASIKRFDSIDGGQVVDENTGEHQVPICRLRPKIELVAMAQPPKRFVSLPLMKLHLGADGSFQFNKYWPPLLRIEAANFLGSYAPFSVMQQLITEIRKKAIQLAKVSEQGSGRSGAVMTAQNRYLIQCLIAELPQMEVLISSKHTHPFSLYLGLSRMLGQIAVLGNRPIPPVLPPYRHDHMVSGFMVAVKSIEEFINAISILFSFSAFTQEQNGEFFIELDKEWPHDYLLVELKGGKEQNRQGMIDWLMQCRIASASVLPSLGKYRHPGAQREVVLKDEELNVQTTPGNVLIKIKNDPQFIKPGQKLMMSCTDEKQIALQPDGIILYIPQK